MISLLKRFILAASLGSVLFSPFARAEESPVADQLHALIGKWHDGAGGDRYLDIEVHNGHEYGHIVIQTEREAPLWEDIEFAHGVQRSFGCSFAYRLEGGVVHDLTLLQDAGGAGCPRDTEITMVRSGEMTIDLTASNELWTVTKNLSPSGFTFQQSAASTLPGTFDVRGFRPGMTFEEVMARAGELGYLKDHEIFTRTGAGWQSGYVEFDLGADSLLVRFSAWKTGDGIDNEAERNVSKAWLVKFFSNYGYYNSKPATATIRKSLEAKYGGVMMSFNNKAVIPFNQKGGYGLDQNCTGGWASDIIHQNVRLNCGSMVFLHNFQPRRETQSSMSVYLINFDLVAREEVFRLGHAWDASFREELKAVPEEELLEF